MRKTNLLNKTILFTSICILSFSCQKQDLTTNPPIEPLKNKAVSVTRTLLDTSLLTNLSYYNSTHGNSLTTKDACSGFWDCVGFSLGIATGDIVGAGGAVQAAGSIIAGAGISTGGTGGIVLTVIVGSVGAAGGSYAAYKTMAPTKLDQDAPKLGVLNINTPLSLNPVFFEIGIDHNNVLHNQFFNDVPFQEYYDHKGITSQEEIDLLNSTEVKTLYRTIKDAGALYGQNRDYRAMSQTLLNNHVITGNVKEVLDLFLDEYLTCTAFPQLEPLINYYIGQVDASSNLSDNEKLALFGAFMVASQSPFYFSTN